MSLEQFASYPQSLSASETLQRKCWRLSSIGNQGEEELEKSIFDWKTEYKASFQRNHRRKRGQTHWSLRPEKPYVAVAIRSGNNLSGYIGDYAYEYVFHFRVPQRPKIQITGSHGRNPKEAPTWRKRTESLLLGELWKKTNKSSGQCPLSFMKVPWVSFVVPRQPKGKEFVPYAASENTGTQRSSQD